MPKRAVASKPRALVKQKKKANGYKFPEHIPSGFIVQDARKQEWLIKDTIGTGGFGEIYSANLVKDTSSSKNKSYYAIKVEPKENGPLFVEMHFYMRVCKEADVREWMKKINVNSFGIPIFHGSGSFEFKSNNYRFLVTDRLKRDLQSLLTENGGQFPLNTVLQIGIQVINVLVYIHNQGYFHGDIKAANLMFGMRPGTENTLYLIDFGLAAKCTITDKEFNKDPKKAHNGTIEYISRDGHSGIFGFRGDLEILGFNLLHWVNGSLPWKKCLSDPTAVEQMKIELMKEPAKYMKKHLPKVPEELRDYLQYITSLKNNDVPDYDHCKRLLGKRLAELKISPYGKLSFTNDDSVDDELPAKGRKKATTMSKVKKATPKKRKIALQATEEEETESDESAPTLKKRIVESGKTELANDTNGVTNQKAKDECAKKYIGKAKASGRTAHTKGTKRQPLNEQADEEIDDEFENEDLTTEYGFANKEEKRLLEKIASNAKSHSKKARSKAEKKQVVNENVDEEEPESENKNSTGKAVTNSEEKRLLDKVASKTKSSSKTTRSKAGKKQLVHVDVDDEESESENEDLTTGKAVANSEEKRLLDKVASKAKPSSKTTRSKAEKKQLVHEEVDDEESESENEDLTTGIGVVNSEEKRLFDKVASKGKASSKTRTRR